LSDKVTVKVKSLLVSAALPETIFSTERSPVGFCIVVFLFKKNAVIHLSAIIVPLSFSDFTV